MEDVAPKKVEAKKVSPPPVPSVPSATTGAKPEAKKIGAEENMVLGTDYEKTVTNLTEMGFTRDEVIKALKAAFNNPERATDYLVNVRQKA